MPERVTRPAAAQFLGGTGRLNEAGEWDDHGRRASVHNSLLQSNSSKRLDPSVILSGYLLDRNALKEDPVIGIEVGAIRVDARHPQYDRIDGVQLGVCIVQSDDQPM